MTSTPTNPQPSQPARQRSRSVVLMLAILTGLSLTVTMGLLVYLYFFEGRDQGLAGEPTQAGACGGPYLVIFGQRFPLEERQGLGGGATHLMSAEVGVVYLLDSQEAGDTFGMSYPQDMQDLIERLEVGTIAILEQPDCSTQFLVFLALERLPLSGIGLEADGVILFVLGDPTVPFTPEPATPTLVEEPVTITPSPSATPTETATPTDTATETPEMATVTLSPTQIPTSTTTVTVTVQATPTVTPTIFMVEITVDGLRLSDDKLRLEVEITIENTGNQPALLTENDIYITGEDDPAPIRPVLLEPALPRAINPSSSQSFTIEFPRPPDNFGILHIWSEEIEFFFFD
jgi:hypothetical protein